MNDKWKNSLNSFFGDKKQEPVNREVSEMASFIENVAIPAFAEISGELQKHDRQTNVRNSETSAAIMVYKGREEEFTYRLQGRTFPSGVMPYAEMRFRQRGGLRFITVEEMLRSSTDCSIRDITRDEVVQHFVRNYTTRVEHA
jgi:hypothetical protein